MLNSSPRNPLSPSKVDLESFRELKASRALPSEQFPTDARRFLLFKYNDVSVSASYFTSSIIFPKYVVCACHPCGMRIRSAKATYGVGTTRPSNRLLFQFNLLGWGGGLQSKRRWGGWRWRTDNDRQESGVCKVGGNVLCDVLGKEGESVCFRLAVLVLFLRFGM